MTVPTSDNREEYTGNGVATSFDYAFKIFEDSDLQVYLQESDGTETLLTLNTDYSVSGAGDLAGGSVTYPLSGDPLASDEQLIILRVLPVVQETDLRNQGAYYPQVVEDEFDRSRMIDQQQQEEIDRSLKRPAAEDGYDADGRQIKNTAAGTDPNDVVNKAQVDSRFANDVITQTSGRWDGKGKRATNFQTSNTPASDELVNAQYLEAYVASVIAGGEGVIPETYFFDGDGSTTVFSTPGITALDPSSYTVTIDGIDQRPGTDYTVDVASETVTFNEAPPVPFDGTDDNVMVRVLAYKQAISEVQTALVDTETGIQTVPDAFNDRATKTEVDQRVIRVGSVAEIAGYSVPAGYVFSLNDGGRSGTFDVVAGDFSAELAADTENGVYVGLSDDPTAASKVVKRRNATTEKRWLSSWFNEDLDALFALSPRKVRLSPQTYSRSSTITIDFPCDIDLNGASLDVSTDGLYPSGFQISSDNVSIYNGSIDVAEVQSGYVGQSTNLGACINVGLKGTTLNAYSNFQLYDLSLSANRENGGGHITIWGGANKGKIERIDFTGNANPVGALINIEWSGNGVDTTYHPHDIEIKNLTANGYPNMAAYAAVVRISGGYNITVDGIDADEVSGLFAVAAGDYANTRSPANQASKVLKGISAINLSGTEIHANALQFTSKAGLSADVLDSQIEVDNINAVAVSGSTEEAIDAPHSRYATVSNFYFEGFNAGWRQVFSGQDNVLRDGKFKSIKTYAANIDLLGGASDPDGNLIDNVKFVDINTNLVAGAGGSAVQLFECRNTTVRNCVLGEDGETETANYFVYISPNEAFDAKVYGNHTYDSSTGNDMYVGPAAVGDENALIVNNTAATGITKFGGVRWVEVGETRVRYGTAAPTAGTHNVGDIVISENSTVDGNSMIVDRYRCVASGTPGTWAICYMSTVSPAV